MLSATRVLLVVFVIASVAHGASVPGGPSLFACSAQLNVADAAVWFDSETSYLFEGNFYFLYDHVAKSVTTVGLISSSWPSVPNDINAAVRYQTNGDVYFFKGTQVWRYDVAGSGVVSGYPKSITNLAPGSSGLPSSPDAIERRTDNKFRMYKGTQSWLYNEVTGMEDEQPTTHGFGFGINAALMSPFHADATYFFAGPNTFVRQSGVFMAGSPFPMCWSCKGSKVVGVAISGVIAPFSNGTYTNNQMCKWKFDFPQSGYFSFNTTWLDTEAGYDTVALYDGTYETDPQLFQQDGSVPASAVVTTLQKALLKFESDSTVVASGFAIAWEYFIKCPPLSGPVVWSPFNDGFRGDTVTAACNAGYSLSGTASRTCLASGLWSGLNDQSCSAIPCIDMLNAPLHGSVSTTTGSTDDVALFECNTGYTLSGSASRTCLSDQSWSGSNDQVCEPNPCPTLSSPLNGFVTPMDGNTGDTSTYSCAAGYTLSGTSSRTCLASGAWSGAEDQVCTGLPCSPNLVAPTDGSVSGTTGTTGVTRTYSCNAGYSLSGSSSRTCQANGMWTASPPMCTPVPCAETLVGPTYGSVSQSTGNVGTTVHFSCSAGYSLSGDANRTCEASLMWSGSDNQVCNPLPCPVLAAPAHGNVSVSGAGAYTDVAVYTCNSGYTISGSSSRTCQVNQVWSGSAATCTALPCPTLSSIANGVASPSLSGSTGATVAFSCNGGYVLSGTASRTCQANQQWSGASDQVCTTVPNYCPSQSAPVNGTLDSLTRIIDGEAVVSCNSGYTMVGTAVRTCQSDANWSGTAPLCTSCSGNCETCVPGFPLDCNTCVGGWTIGDECLSRIDPYCPPLPPPINGTHSVGVCTRKVDDVCGTTSCNAGYFLSGPTSRTCQSDAAWSGLASTCSACMSVCATCDVASFNCITCAPGLLGPPACDVPVTCPPLMPPANGDLTPQSNVSGVTVEYECEPGYALSGDATRTCGTDGTWSGSDGQNCVANSCSPALTAPAFGTVDGTSATTDEVRTYACNAGYQLSGSPTRTCQATGQWTGSAPTCTALACDELSTPDKGSVDGTSGSTGTVRQFSCFAGYSLAGPEYVECLPNSTWSAAEPTCVGNPCSPTLVAPVNGTVSQTTGGTGDVATFACNAGYNLVGSAVRTCQSDGSWTETSPLCTIADCTSLSEIQTPPANGRLTCPGASVGDTCIISCNAGYSPFGTTARTCLADSSWSGTEDVLCSSAMATDTLVSYSTPVVVEAGYNWVFHVGLFDASGSPASTPNVISVFREVSPGTLVATVVSADERGGGVTATMYDVVSTVPTTAATYTYEVQVNGVAVSAPFPLTVVPSLPDGTKSVASGTGLEAAVLGAPAPIAVEVRDSFSNVVGSADTTGVDVSVRVKVGTDERLLVPTSVTSGTFAFAFEPWKGGVYTLSIEAAGDAVAGSPWVVFVASRCPRGQYAVEETGPCETCPVNTYTDAVNEPECKACPTSTSTHDGVGSASITNCTCVAGTHAAEPGIACSACPEGGSCSGKLAAPVSLPGYYPDAEGGFVACRRTSGCAGANLCAPGYEGFQCNSCADGWYSDADQNCSKCPKASSFIFAALVLGVVLFGVLAAAAVVVSRLNTTALATSSKDGVRRRNVPASLAMVVVAFQTVGILADSNLSWTSASRTVLEVFNFANVDISLFATDCTLTSFYVTYVVAVVIPLLFLLAGLVALVVLKILIKFGVVKHEMGGVGELSVRTLGDSVLFIVAPLLYIPAARATFKIFDCSRLSDGSYVLDADYGVACFDSRWWSYAWVGGLGVSLYVLGVPAYFLWCVVRRRERLMDPDVYRKFGPLYNLYRAAYYWAGVADLGKRLALVVVSVFFSRHPLAQIGIMLVVLLTVCLFVRSNTPFYYQLYNELDFRLNSVLILILLLGTGSYAERRGEGSADTFFLIGIVAAVACLLLVAAWGIFLDVRQIIHRRRGIYSDRRARLQRIIGMLEAEALDMDDDVAHALLALTDNAAVQNVLDVDPMAAPPPSADADPLATIELATINPNADFGSGFLPSPSSSCSSGSSSDS